MTVIVASVTYTRCHHGWTVPETALPVLCRCGRVCEVRGRHAELPLRL